MAFYDNLKLEKGMYNSGNKSFTQVLEELDCSKTMKGQNGRFGRLSASIKTF